LLPLHGHFLYFVERVKDFVNVHLHCIASSSGVASPKIWGQNLLTLSQQPYFVWDTASRKDKMT